ncbi:zinc transporter 1 isoform X1 [Tetranychus urticae]|uniref:zinc transporter 1 isoform X1 n=1 Tax=Tetranychus urticae TaxID=32264 RepID=UPI00077B9959|nr:zinc transporter 1 isoform X1 [Tetranychus urticae]
MTADNKGARMRLLFMLILTITFFFVELIVGYITNSMALIADSFHMLSDVIALIIAYVSVLMSPKEWVKNTFGWARAEVLGALVNAVFLIALCFSIFVESIKRFYNPEELHAPSLLLGVGVAGLIVNIIGLILFHGAGGHSHGKNHKDYDESEGGENGQEKSKYIFACKLSADINIKLIYCLSTDEPTKKAPQSSDQMNIRGVFLHILADALGSVIVCISALIIMFTDWSIVDYVDPTLSILMVTLIMYSTWPLLSESAMILLQTVPTHIEVEDLRETLTKEIKGVLAVHEFHVWQLTGDRIIASAHIQVQNLQDYMRIAEKVKEFFHNKGIHSTTIQPEFVDLKLENFNFKDGCILNCSRNLSCVASTCCGLKDSMKYNSESKGKKDKSKLSENTKSKSVSEVSVTFADADASETEDVGPDSKLSTSRSNLDK